MTILYVCLTWIGCINILQRCKYTRVLKRNITQRSILDELCLLRRIHVLSFGSYVFGELDYINKLRNRIAHHEPICFSKNPVSIDTKYIHNRYNRIMELFRWMDIDGASLLYGLGHIDNACNQIDALLK